ncbi:hypothetical protein BBI09_18260 [Stutzerimonas xanthomarina]|nr:hypothetical protein BBI09_18260 [Stutzerimonas xanthomarina]
MGNAGNNPTLWCFDLTFFKVRRNWLLEFHDRGLTAALDHSYEIFFRAFAYRIRFPPLLRQPPGNGRGEDRLAEAFEQGGDGVDAGFEGIDLGQQFIDFLGDAGLFVQRGKTNLNFLQIFLCDLRLRRSCDDIFKASSL